MNLHPNADPTFDRIFAQSPRHASNATPLIDENRELRNRLIDARVLVPACAPRGRTQPIAVMPVDASTFHGCACEIVTAHGVPAARQLADCAETDPRLQAALRVVLSLPVATRDQVVSRARKGRR